MADRCCLGTFELQITQFDFSGEFIVSVEMACDHVSEIDAFALYVVYCDTRRADGITFELDKNCINRIDCHDARFDCCFTLS